MGAEIRVEIRFEIRANAGSVKIISRRYVRHGAGQGILEVLKTGAISARALYCNPVSGSCDLLLIVVAVVTVAVIVYSDSFYAKSFIDLFA